MKPVRYGLIGFGGIAEGRIAPEGFALDRARFSPLDEAKLLGATSRSDTRRGTAESMGIRWYDSVDELVADRDIDAVFVASDNLNHQQHGMAALRAGKHLLMDKPITTTMAEARELQEEARRRGLSLGINHMMVHNVLNQEARRLVEKGRIGTVSDIALHFEFSYGQTPQERESWRCAVPEERGGPIGDVASHALYVAELLLSTRVSRVGCSYAPKSLDIAVESGADLRFETESGIGGRIRVGFDARGRDLAGTILGCGYEVYGSRGIVRGYGTLGQLSGHADEPVVIRLELDDFDAAQQIEAGPPRNMYAEVIRQHARSIVAKEPLDGSAAVHNLALVLKAYESADRGGAMLDVAH